jgi:hypothetical protein
MATIRIKRGTGTPGHAALTVGEPAVNTSLNTLFIKTASAGNSTDVKLVGAEIEAQTAANGFNAINWGSASDSKLATQNAIETRFMPKAGGTFTGAVSFGQGSTAAGEIRLLEDEDDGFNYSAFRGSARSANITYVMPTTDPTSGQVLSAGAPSSNVSTLSWIDSGSASTIAVTDDDATTTLYPMFSTVTSGSTTTKIDSDGMTYNASTDSLTIPGDLAVNGADITTSSTGTATVFNTNATTFNMAGAATSLTIGATTGTTHIRNAAIRLGNTTGEISTSSGSTNHLTLIPYGDVIISPSSNVAPSNDGTFPVLTVNNGVLGTFDFVGGDIYLGAKTNDDLSPVVTSVNIIWEGSGDDGNETTLTVANPTGDRTITLPDATGTVALVAGSDTQVLFNDGGSALGGDAGLTYNKSNDSLTITGDLAVNGADITTSSTGTATVFNTNATTLNVGGAATSLTIGATTGTAHIRNAQTRLGNTVATITTTSGASTNNLTITPFGNLILSPTSSVMGLNGATGCSLTVSNLQNGLGTFDFGGGDVYLGIKTNESAVTTSVNIIWEGSGPDGNETTLTVANPTGDRTITLPDATGTVALVAGSDTQVLFNDGGSALGGDSGLTYNKTTDSLTITGDLAVNGADITTTSTGTATVFNTNATTVNMAGAGTTVSIGAVTGTTTINNANTVVTGDLAVNGADITTSSTGTATVFNTNATTLNVGGAATTVTIGASNATINLGGGTTGATVNVKGNLVVDGTTTTINSTTLTVDDKNIELGSVTSPTDTTADGGGITLKGTTDKTIIWDDTNDNWTSSEHWNIVTGKSFKINNTSVLNATTLGSGVTGSSLTSVGALSSGSITTGFTQITAAGLVGLGSLDIDGGTATTTIAGTDLLIVDDGANGTNRYVTVDNLFGTSSTATIDGGSY